MKPSKRKRRRRHDIATGFRWKNRDYLRRAEENNRKAEELLRRLDECVRSLDHKGDPEVWYPDPSMAKSEAYRRWVDVFPPTPTVSQLLIRSELT